MDRAVRTFDISHCLGRGGFGEVYRATMRTQGGLESDVALKVLRRDLDPSGQAVQRLRDEGRLLARLDHPVILRVHDLAVLNGRVALVTEYIAGEDLEGAARRRGMPVRALLEVVAKVAHALDAAWNAPLNDGTALRLVHRDIKPSNIRLGKHGEVKLLDFGIARTDALVREARTQTDMLVGSPSYMAPERFRSNTVDPASDVFALGATLLEGLTGRRFYGRMEIVRIAGLSLDAESFEEHVERRMAGLPVGLPEELVELLRQTLLRDPAERISAAELADRAELIAEEVGGDSLARWCRKRTWPKESAEEAELSGQTISEGTFSIAPATEPAPSLDSGPVFHAGGPDQTAPVEQHAEPPFEGDLPPPTRPGPSPLLGLILVGIVLGGGTLGLFSAVGLGGLAMNFWRAPTAAAPAPQPPVEAPEPSLDEAGAPEEPPVEELAADPAPPAPKPAAPSPGPRAPSPAPAPAPAPTTPEPAPPVVPQPTPVEEPQSTTGAPGRVEVEGGVPVEAIGPGGPRQLPADLAPGTWLFRAHFSTDFVREVGTIDVKDGGRWTVVCRARMTNCTIRSES